MFSKHNDGITRVHDRIFLVGGRGVLEILSKDVSSLRPFSVMRC